MLKLFLAVLAVTLFAMTDFHTTTTQTPYVNDIAWHPNGTLFAVATDTGVQLLDKNQHLIQQLPGYRGKVESITWNPDGQALAALGIPLSDFDFWEETRPHYLLVWTMDAETNAYVLNQSIPYDHPYVLDHPNVVALKHIAWSPLGHRLTFVESRWPGGRYELVNDFVVIWDTDLWLPIQELTCAYENVQQLTWSPNGQFIVGYGQETWSYFQDDCPEDIKGNAGLFIADANTGERVTFIIGSVGENDIDWFDDSHLAVMGGAILFYDVLADGTLTNERGFYDKSRDQSYGYFQAEWFDDGRHMLVLYSDYSLNRVNMQTFRVQKLMQAPGLYHMALNQDQVTLAIVDINRVLSIMQVPDFTTCPVELLKTKSC